MTELILIIISVALTGSTIIILEQQRTIEKLTNKLSKTFKHLTED